MADLIPDTAFGRRAAQRLANERVAWLTTVGRDGAPQPNPVWFIWDGADEILTYNLPDAYRATHIAERPNVSLHFNSNTGGDDVVVVRGTAARADDVPPADESPAYVAKYGADMARISGTAGAFARRYSTPIRITITRVRGH